MGSLRNVGNFLSFGAIDRRDAKVVVKNADTLFSEVKEEIDDARERTQKDIQGLGELKEATYTGSINQFALSYEVIGKVDVSALRSSESIDFESFDVEIKGVQKTSLSLKEVSTSLAAGALAGTSMAFGAMGGVALLATASTGTAIGTLSGAAATNATLAWLGGGAVSAGGAGVSGGMVVLGGVALAPILVFGMFLGTNNGKKALNEAENYSDEMDVHIEQAKTFIAQLAQVRRGCYLMHGAIEGLDAVLKLYNVEMNKIVYRLESRPAFARKFIDPIKSKLFGLSVLTENEAGVFSNAANVASMLSGVIKMPLMDSDGAFISNNLDELISYQDAANTLDILEAA